MMDVFYKGGKTNQELLVWFFTNILIFGLRMKCEKKKIYIF